jgi:hypothetical protein
MIDDIQIAGIVGVGSSAVLGCIHVILIIMLVIEAAMLVMCAKFLCEDYKSYRQAKNRRRKYEDTYCKECHPTGLNLGVFGKSNLESKRRAFPLMRIHVQILEIMKNLVGFGARKPIMPLKHISSFRNFFGCLSHRRSMQPNI